MVFLKPKILQNGRQINIFFCLKSFKMIDVMIDKNKE